MLLLLLLLHCSRGNGAIADRYERLLSRGGLLENATFGLGEWNCWATFLSDCCCLRAVVHFAVLEDASQWKAPKEVGSGLGVAIMMTVIVGDILTAHCVQVIGG